MSNSTYTVRELEHEDYYKGYLDLINTFTRSPENKSFDEFCRIVDIIHSQNSHIYVIEHENKIISTIKTIIEQKMHNNFKCVLHIEDLVTHENYRKKGLASILIKHVVNLGKSLNCYKIILCSNINNEDFYLKQQFIKKGTEFSLYLN
jgi:glucosamine-phosphate N-acetyltransferase